MARRPPRSGSPPPPRAPGSAPGPGAGSDEDEDDRALWRHVTRDVRPLAPRDLLRPARRPDRPPEPTPEPPGDARPAPASAPARRRPPPPLPAGPVAPGPLAPGRTAGVDRRTADRLRRGRLAVEAVLDLHGLTQTAAHAALVRFVRDSHAHGRRTLLVVTGKGDPAQAARRHGGPPEGRGVLRARVPEWLNAPELRDRILAIETAQPRHGGTGALYVLLRRQR